MQTRAAKVIELCWGMKLLKTSQLAHMNSALQIGVIYGNPEVTSGGNALKFYASVRLEVRRKATQESSKGDSIGIRVKAKVCLISTPCSCGCHSFPYAKSCCFLCSHDVDMQ